MKNFNIYDPMKKGEGLVLDGQTLGHIEVISTPFLTFPRLTVSLFNIRYY